MPETARFTPVGGLDLRLGLSLFCVLSLLPQLTAGDLEAEIRPWIDAHKGQVAVAIKHLGTGESFYFQADQPMPTASLIKLPVMIEAYRQAEAGTLSLDDKVTLTDDDKVPGAGILTKHFSEGASFPLRDAIQLMIVYSDNTATNLVLDKIGLASPNKLTADWQLPNTRINAKVYKGSTTSLDPKRTKEFGLGSTTARETLTLLEKIQNGTAVSAPASAAMLKHLEANNDKEMLVRFLPPGTKVAHKTGAVTEVRTDAGLITMPDKSVIAICVLTADNEDQRWVLDNQGQLTIARIGQSAYDYFAKKAKPAAK